MKVSRLKLIEELGAANAITKTQAENFLTSLVKSIYVHLAEGDSVNITGFGHFSVSHRHARLGVNPRNPSVKITIPELNTVKFKAGEAFKNAVKLR